MTGDKEDSTNPKANTNSREDRDGLIKHDGRKNGVMMDFIFGFPLKVISGLSSRVSLFEPTVRTHRGVVFHLC